MYNRIPHAFNHVSRRDAKKPPRLRYMTESQARALLERRMAFDRLERSAVKDRQPADDDVSQQPLSDQDENRVLDPLRSIQQQKQQEQWEKQEKTRKAQDEDIRQQKRVLAFLQQCMQQQEQQQLERKLQEQQQRVLQAARNAAVKAVKEVLQQYLQYKQRRKQERQQREQQHLLLREQQVNRLYQEHLQQEQGRKQQREQQLSSPSPNTPPPPSPECLPPANTLAPLPLLSPLSYDLSYLQSEQKTIVQHHTLVTHTSSTHTHTAEQTPSLCLDAPSRHHHDAASPLYGLQFPRKAPPWLSSAHRIASFSRRPTPWPPPSLSDSLSCR